MFVKMRGEFFFSTKSVQIGCVRFQLYCDAIIVFSPCFFAMPDRTRVNVGS